MEVNVSLRWSMVLAADWFYKHLAPAALTRSAPSGQRIMHGVGSEGVALG
jgi:hypothetical protein